MSTTKAQPLHRRDINEQAFWRHVEQRRPSDCWNWSGAIRNGYGAFGVAGRTQYAHRVAYALAHGAVPDGKLLRHTCDNRRCCNAAHLELGDDIDNARDAVQRGQMLSGVRSPQAKLSVRQVNRLRELAASGARIHELSKLFNISSASVENILRGRTYVREQDLLPAHIVEGTADILSALEVLRDMQTIVSGQLGDDALQPTRENTALYFLALIDEVTELLHELNWKSWANAKQVNVDRVASEFADILAFLGVIVGFLEAQGISLDSLANAYLDKSQINIRRFHGKIAGYDKVTDRQVNAVTDGRSDS